MSFTDVHLVGCGGTGSALAPQLARLCAYHEMASNAPFTLWDGDTFEPRNLARQVCSAQHNEQNKALVTQQLLAEQGLTVQATPRFVNGILLRGSVGACPLMVNAVDNDATRASTLNFLDSTCESFFWVSPGNNDDSDGLGRISCSVLWWGRLSGVEVGIDPRTAYDNIANPTDALPVDGGCLAHAPSAPQLITANALAASLTLLVLQNLFDGRLPARSSSVVMDGRDLKLSFF